MQKEAGEEEDLDKRLQEMLEEEEEKHRTKEARAKSRGAGRGRGRGRGKGRGRNSKAEFQQEGDDQNKVPPQEPNARVDGGTPAEPVKRVHEVPAAEQSEVTPKRSKLMRKKSKLSKIRKLASGSPGKSPTLKKKRRKTPARKLPDASAQGAGLVKPEPGQKGQGKGGNKPVDPPAPEPAKASKAKPSDEETNAKLKEPRLHLLREGFRAVGMIHQLNILILYIITV